MPNHTDWMKKALELAQRAAEHDEVPVGAIVVRGDKIIGEGYNRRESLKKPTAHAEILAIEDAADYLESWRLNGCTLYVTLEPCPMCAGAILNARIDQVVYGASDPKAGAVGSLFQLLGDQRLNHRCDVLSGVLAEESSQLLKTFFEGLREKK